MSARYGKIPHRVVHLNAFLAVLTTALRLRTLEIQMNAVTGRRKLNICRLSVNDRSCNIVEFLCFGVIAMVYIDADYIVIFGEHITYTGIIELRCSVKSRLIIAPCIRVIGHSALTRFRIDRHFLRFAAVRVGFVSPAYPLLFIH